MNKLLKDYLERHNFTYARLGKILNCTPGTITHWLYGRARPRPKTAFKLAKISANEIPITHWGYICDSKGKIRRVSDGPIEIAD